MSIKNVSNFGGILLIGFLLAGFIAIPYTSAEPCPDGMTWSTILNACEANTPNEDPEPDPPGTAPATVTKLANPLGSDYDSLPKVAVGIIDNIIIPVAVPFVALAIIW